MATDSLIMGSEHFNIHSEDLLWWVWNREGMLSRKPGSALFKKDKRQLCLENTTAKLLLHEGRLQWSTARGICKGYSQIQNHGSLRAVLQTGSGRKHFPPPQRWVAKWEKTWHNSDEWRSRCCRWKTWLVSCPCFFGLSYRIHQIQW